MTDQKNAAAQDFEVTQAREIAGAYREAGEIVSMTAAQAKYYLPPYGDGLKPYAAKAAAKVKASDAKADARDGNTDA